MCNDFAAAAGGPRMGKHHGSEGRKVSKIATKKVPNVTSETNRKG